jgi:serine/threonine-protein kinase
MLANRYQVGELIGRGGMAEVHIGYDTRLGRTVAIKVLRPDLARDPSFQTRFRREAQAAAGLNHPAIVAVYDTGEEAIISASGERQILPFIVMEYVEGHTVRDILKEGAAAPIDEAIEIVAGVLTGLEYAHAAGLVHRDIKPANIMLTPTGAVKVMDFGIARVLADVGQTMTQTQAVIGTAQYLSPEQARGENVDARSDLYSTGCVLFELLCGRPPFLGDSPVSVAYQHVREPAPKPSSFAPDVPPALDLVVMRALAKDREARYPSAQEFLADLSAVAQGRPLDIATGQYPVGSASPGSRPSAVLAAAAGGTRATKAMQAGG